MDGRRVCTGSSEWHVCKRGTWMVSCAAARQSSGRMAAKCTRDTRRSMGVCATCDQNEHELALWCVSKSKVAFEYFPLPSNRDGTHLWRMGDISVSGLRVRGRSCTCSGGCSWDGQGAQALVTRTSRPKKRTYTESMHRWRSSCRAEKKPRNPASTSNAPFRDSELSLSCVIMSLTSCLPPGALGKRRHAQHWQMTALRDHQHIARRAHSQVNN